MFPSVADAAQRLAELKSFKPPLGDGYDYQSGTAILRLSDYLTPAQARAYAAAFITTVGEESAKCRTARSERPAGHGWRSTICLAHLGGTTTDTSAS